MTIQKYYIDDNEYKVYSILHKNQIIQIGDKALGDKIDECIEQELYLHPIVKDEFGGKMTIEELDDQIACFLGDVDNFPNPTKNDILENIRGIGVID